MNIPDRLITCQQLSPMAIVMYLTLKFYADTKGVIKDLSIEAMGLSVSSYLRHIEQLIRHGFVIVENKRGRGQTNIYRIIK